MKNLLKKQQGFTLIELLIVIAILGVLSSIAIPTYKDYMTSSKWAKAIASTRALKLAVEHCSSDNGGDFKQCDSIDPSGQLVGYGATKYADETEDFSSIVLIPNKAAIKITGLRPLADCILTITPSFSSQIGMITWDYTIKEGSDYANTTKCRSFVKGAIAG